MPDLGELAGPDAKRQHIVDHGLVQDADGNWRIWACLRGVSVGRLLYAWKSPELFAESWEPLGIAARAERRFGEQVKDDGDEKIGAPFFLKHGETWYCFYHSGGIRVMKPRKPVRPAFRIRGNRRKTAASGVNSAHCKSAGPTVPSEYVTAARTRSTPNT